MGQCIGCGLKTVDGILTAEISLAAGNALSCTSDGLYVPVPADAVGLSPNACNAITNPGNGLYSPCMRGTAGGTRMFSPQNAALPVAASGPGGSYEFLSDQITITNPNCREVGGLINITVGGLLVDTGAGGYFGTARLDVNIDGSGWVMVAPSTAKRVHGASLFADYNNMGENNYLSVSAGDSVTYQARLIVDVDSGSGTLHGAVDFEFCWCLTAVGAC